TYPSFLTFSLLTIHAALPIYPDARDMVCNAFSSMYQENASDFPMEAKEVEYRNRMVSCYPIHPEIFDRLYGDWATLERFQRTRGDRKSTRLNSSHVSISYAVF